LASEAHESVFDGMAGATGFGSGVAATAADGVEDPVASGAAAAAAAVGGEAASAIVRGTVRASWLACRRRRRERRAGRCLGRSTARAEPGGQGRKVTRGEAETTTARSGNTEGEGVVISVVSRLYASPTESSTTDDRQGGRRAGSCVHSGGDCRKPPGSGAHPA
jgi:hypothetical protein